MHLIRRVTDEAKEFSIIAVYLFVCFTALFYLKASILEAHGIEFAPFGFAAAKALICAKFILLGRALRAGEWFKSLPLIWPTLYNSIVFLVLLLALNAGEEVALGLFHHRNVAISWWRWRASACGSTASRKFRPCARIPITVGAATPFYSSAR